MGVQIFLSLGHVSAACAEIGTVAHSRANMALWLLGAHCLPGPCSRATQMHPSAWQPFSGQFQRGT